MIKTLVEGDACSTCRASAVSSGWRAPMIATSAASTASTEVVAFAEIAHDLHSDLWDQVPEFPGQGVTPRIGHVQQDDLGIRLPNSGESFRRVASDTHDG